MKKGIIYILILSSALFSGCKKYLDQEPDQRTQLNTPAKVSELLVTAYPRGSYFAFAESRTDNPEFVSLSGIVSNVNINSYFFEDIKETGTDSPTYYWNSCYTAIAAANLALATCENAANPAEYQSQKGEALLARAYAHFMLVTFFSKVYDPATAATDLGIPYVTTPENVVIKQYERKTVAYVYEQIEKDLLEGLPLIKDAYTVPAYHFTKKAANAFATRFYLFKKDYAKVVQYANNAFPTNNFASNVRPWLSYQNFTTDELRAAYTNATNPGNLLITECVTQWPTRFRNYVYSMSQNKINAVKSPLGQSFSALKQYSLSSTFYYILKFYNHFVITNVQSQTGVAYGMMPVLTTEEVLLNRAESYVMQDNYTAALADMNTLISTRTNSYVPATHNFTDARIKAYYATKTTDTREAYLMAVLEVRRAEFVHEGVRWFDILRHNITVSRRDPVNQNTIVAELVPNDLRRVFQVPDETSLSGIEKNPR